MENVVMKICLPTQEDKGTDSQVYGHFGSAPYFVLYDAVSKKIETINNKDKEHAHGACHPLSALDDRKVDAIVVGGIGARALMGLNAGGIRVFKAEEGTVQQNVDALVEGKLPEMILQHACQGHSGDGGCCGH